MKKLKNNISLSDYKKHTRQEFLKGDENFCSIILTFDRNYLYCHNK